jgi:hypothetical protein
MLSNSIMKFFCGLALMINGVLSQGPIGGTLDANNCLVGAGYTWCQSTNSCVRMWETPCEDNFNGCDDCLTKQRTGMNIACPSNCDLIDPIIYTKDPVYEPVYEPVCPDVMCMMYCPNGHQIDSNGCQVCQCNEAPRPTPQPTPIPPTIKPVTILNDETNSECPLIQPSCEGHSYVCPKLREITHCNQGGIDGHTTYQLSLVIQPNSNVENIYALFGNGNNDENMYLPAAYQSPVNQGQNIGGINQYMLSIFPQSVYDSWLTIGITDGDKENLLSAVGINFDEWTESSALNVDNGAVFVMDPSSIDPSSIDITNQGQEIIIAQLTVPTRTTATAVFNVQGKTLTNNPNIPDSKIWTESNIQFPLIPPVSLVPNHIPSNCVSWYDGCNTCTTQNGIIGGCTRMMCFREDTPRCLQYASGH